MPSPCVVDDQYFPVPLTNVVPPIAVTSGTLAGMFTQIPLEPAESSLWFSHAAGPVSPEETTHVIPCAAACCARLRNQAQADSRFSHSPKLSLIIGARFWSVAY